VREALFSPCSLPHLVVSLSHVSATIRALPVNAPTTEQFTHSDRPAHEQSGRLAYITQRPLSLLHLRIVEISNSELYFHSLTRTQNAAHQDSHEPCAPMPLLDHPILTRFQPQDQIPGNPSSSLKNSASPTKSTLSTTPSLRKSRLPISTPMVALLLLKTQTPASYSGNPARSYSTSSSSTTRSMC
jgi:hypothetical protein